MGEAEPEAVRRSIGAAIRRTRTDAGLTMRGLAVACGVSQPFLSAVERGLSTPSLFTLYRIAEVLNTSPASLLPDPGPGDIVVVRADEGRLVPSSDRPNSALGRLIFSDPERHLEVYEYVADIGQDLDVWFEHPGDTVLHLIDGQLRVEFESRASVHLAAGDSIIHPGKVAHRWVVESETPVRLFLVVVRPSPL
jgi:transcriptional regulator with XRE-family HTH domain